MNWQPMESAPRNGTPVLLRLAKPLSSNDIEGYVPWAEIKVAIGWWDGGSGARSGGPHWELCFMWEGSGDSHGFTSHFFLEIEPGSADAPTGWMPMPE